MTIKMNILSGLLMLSVLLLAGCGQNSITADNEESSKSIDMRGYSRATRAAELDEAAEATIIKEPGEEKESLQANANQTQVLEEENQKVDSITPYQLLNLMAGNAEELSFQYSTYTDNNDKVEKGAFYKMGEKFAAIFETSDMNENEVVVRELEMEGRVHYIIDEYKIVKSYLAPAEDFLLYEMMEIANNTPVKVAKKDECTIYEYSVASEEDAELHIIYRFYIGENVLKKIECSYDNQATKTYEFSEFIQTIKDETVFEYPTGYSEEWYYYTNTGEHMPPWCELGNDE